MKIIAEHYEPLERAINLIETEELRQQYRDGNFSRSELVKDLDKRYRWDLFWYVQSLGVENWPTGEYADAHIDTALRKIVNPL